MMARMVTGILAAPPDIRRHGAIQLTTLSTEYSMKSSRWCTITGRSPALPAPAASAVIPASAIGVSNTRLAPKLSTSPVVVPNIPVGVSAPIPHTKTLGSSSMAWRSAALMACAKLSGVLPRVSCCGLRAGAGMSERSRQRFGLSRLESRSLGPCKLHHVGIFAGRVHADNLLEVWPLRALRRCNGRTDLGLDPRFKPFQLALVEIGSKLGPKPGHGGS